MARGGDKKRLFHAHVYIKTLYRLVCTDKPKINIELDGFDAIFLGLSAEEQKVCINALCRQVNDYCKLK